LALFFLTGSAGTGKSFLLQTIVAALKAGIGCRRHKVLLLSPTSIGAMNIDGTTIHSALRIRSSCLAGDCASFSTLLWDDDNLQNDLRQINTLVIDEVSMVSGDLLSYLSNMFARLHHNHRPFGNVNVILVGDLFQLPPVAGSAVFRAPVWRLFYPLILSKTHRQNDDSGFFDMLEELRFARPSPRTIATLQDRANNFSAAENGLSTTHICGYRRHAERINRLISSSLSSQLSYDHFAKDFINNRPVDLLNSAKPFKGLTNLPDCVHIALGARVMFLDNSLFAHGICNGTIGIILAMNDDDSIKVAFPTATGIQEIDVSITSQRFYVDGAPACRRQFPIQNAFALTVHKTQGLTLPSICLELDETIFACGQAYVAISRAKHWRDIAISSFRHDAFRVDPNVIREYERLQSVAMSTDLYSWQSNNL
jgi:ATP-dependent DNA helicase PIF1